MPDAINLSTQRITACPTLTELSWLFGVFAVPHKSGSRSQTRLLRNLVSFPGLRAGKF